VYRTTPSLPRLAAPLLLAIAIAGFVVGHRHTSATPAGAAAAKTRTVYGASVLLEYPARWQQVEAHLAPAIPGLGITSAVLLSPGGKGVRAGLISGQLPGGGASPLPSAFLAQLHSTPHTDVVDLLDAQAYRYTNLSLPGYNRILELYVIPSPGTGDAALACYASKPLASYLQQCQQIVAGLTLVGRSPTDLTPEAGYAARLGQLVKKLDAKRLKLRAAMRVSATPATLGHLAATLAERFAAAAKSLSVLEPPLPVGPTQATLASAILSARHAYETLAAVAASSSSDYATARASVEAAERDVDAALRNFALLGYSQA
jgi:hypothetical protein